MKAMILAAGLGTRLGSLTSEVPKAMLEIEGRPLLEYVLVNLKRHGFDDVVVNLHYRGDDIQHYFGDGTRWGVRLTYSQEAVLLGTAGGLKQVEQFFEQSDFLIHYGDVVTDENLTEMVRFHRNHAGVATLLVHQRRGSNSVLTVDENGRITKFLERPLDVGFPDDAPWWVHSGICIARPTLLQLIPPDSPADLPRDVYEPSVASGHPFFAWPLTGFRTAVDSPARLEALRTAVREGTLNLTLDSAVRS